MVDFGTQGHPDFDEGPKQVPWHGLGHKVDKVVCKNKLVAEPPVTAEEAKWSVEQITKEVNRLISLAVAGDKAAGERASRLAKRLLRRGGPNG